MNVTFRFKLQKLQASLSFVWLSAITTQTGYLNHVEVNWMVVTVLSYSERFADLDISNVRSGDSSHLTGSLCVIILAWYRNSPWIQASVNFTAGQDNLVLQMCLCCIRTINKCYIKCTYTVMLSMLVTEKYCL